MSKFYTVHRQSATYSGVDTIRTLLGVLLYIWKTYHSGNKELASEYTLTIEEHSHYEDLERKEYKRLKKKYEDK